MQLTFDDLVVGKVYKVKSKKKCLKLCNANVETVEKADTVFYNNGNMTINSLECFFGKNVILKSIDKNGRLGLNVCLEDNNIVTYYIPPVFLKEIKK